MEKDIMMKETQTEIVKSMPELLQDSMMVHAFSSFFEQANKDIRDTFSRKEDVVALMETLQKENWRQMRAYLTVLRENLPLLDLDNQDIILTFLYDMLSHQSGMVRRIAARTYGYILAFRLQEYGVSPEEAIRKVLFPGTAVAASEKRKINYQLKYIIKGFREKADEAAMKQLLNHYAGFFKSSRWDKVTCFYLIMGIIDIPCDDWTSMQKYHIFSFLRNNMMDRKERKGTDRYLSGSAGFPRDGGNMPDSKEEVRLAALYLIKVWLDQGWKAGAEVKQHLDMLSCGEDARVCEKYLISRIHGEGAENPVWDDSEIFKLFQENQHSQAVWINKILNLAILKEYFYNLLEKGEKDLPYYYQYANHLINILRLNKQAVVFLQAGEDLVGVMPYLRSYQKFEIEKDILQALENVDDYYNFAAPFAGRAFLYLDPADQMELIPRLWELTDRKDPMIVNTALEVVTEILKNFYSQAEFGNDIEEHLCSMLSTGLASYKPSIAREAFFLTGQCVIKNIHMTEKRAYDTVLRLARKALICLSGKNSYAGGFYNYSALQHITDQLSTHTLLVDAKEKPRKIAFFSGSFDPFSRGHKAIAREVAEMGYTVYVDAHDFSWYKKLQPREIRRQIIFLSISDLDNVLLFPDEIPISIENPEDLRFLRSLFPESEVTVVVGSDVIENCEAYWKEPEEDSIHQFPHIIVQRGAGISQDLVSPMIFGDTTFLKLPAYFDTMTSFEIQKNIALGRDISEMVDRQVKNYVQDKKLYLGEPMYKKTAKIRAVDFFRIGKNTDIREYMEELLQSFQAAGQPDEWLHKLMERWNPASQIMFMEENSKGRHKVCGAICWHESSVAELYEDCRNVLTAQRLRQIVSGRILVVDGVFGADGDLFDYRMAICNELLAGYQKEEYDYAICFQREEEEITILKRFGFIPAGEDTDCYYVDLRQPLTMFYDIDSFIREPFQTEKLVQDVIRRNKRSLRDNLQKLYPGSLVLHFDAQVLNYHLLKLMTEKNQVPLSQDIPVFEDGTPQSYEAYGEKMCVPFGKLLQGVLVPNTVTKELNIEKIYETDLHNFEIQEFPEYDSLSAQIRTIKAFGRPAVFVDDLLHKGFRMNKIRKVLHEEQMSVDRFVVGVLSGQGRDIAKENQIEVDTVYFVPNMRAWIVESDLYPFIGGDGIRSEEQEKEGITGLPSINLILPYQVPKFLKGASLTEIYHLSEAALMNAREMFVVLEKVYQQKYHRSLTFGRIGEVIAQPRYPEGLVSDGNNDRPVSELLDMELAKLRRMQAVMLFDKAESIRN